MNGIIKFTVESDILSVGFTKSVDGITIDQIDTGMGIDREQFLAALRTYAKNEINKSFGDKLRGGKRRFNGLTEAYTAYYRIHIDSRKRFDNWCSNEFILFEEVSGAVRKKIKAYYKNFYDKHSSGNHDSNWYEKTLDSISKVVENDLEFYKDRIEKLLEAEKENELANNPICHDPLKEFEDKLRATDEAMANRDFSVAEAVWD